MALYQFMLERFHIDNTRSRHEDTDTVAFAVRAGAGQTFVQSKLVGDVNNGDHNVGVASPALYVPADGKLAVFSYFIYNGDTRNLEISLDDEAGKVIDLYTEQIVEGGPSQDPDAEIPDDPSLPDGASFDDTSWVNVLEFAAIGSLLFPDCDGMVAADVIGRSKSELDAAIDAAGGTSYTQHRRYPGTDSPPGCGSNSDYTVTWSVTRFRDDGTHSLRALLARGHAVLQPGIRSLNNGGAVSIRDLLS
ncbi:MAG TPA: hypothetical protein VFQ44_02555 [Streptosporangiaceae bacterium]|nr:hypothetical protein [Streptosporangiaceae bacterium]